MSLRFPFFPSFSSGEELLFSTQKTWIVSYNMASNRSFARFSLQDACRTIDSFSCCEYT